MLLDKSVLQPVRLMGSGSSRFVDPDDPSDTGMVSNRMGMSWLGRKLTWQAFRNNCKCRVACSHVISPKKSSFFFTDVFQTHVGDEIAVLQLRRTHAFKLGLAAVVTVYINRMRFRDCFSLAQQRYASSGKNRRRRGPFASWALTTTTTKIRRASIRRTSSRYYMTSVD